MPELSEIAILISLFFLTGMVKGFFGIGIPPILLGTLTFIHDPRYVLTLIMIPVVASNARQALRGGDVGAIIGKHKWFVPTAMVAITVSAYFGGAIPSDSMSILTGCAMVLFALTSLINRVPPLPSLWFGPVQVLAGIASGLLGGISGIWGPPMLVYLFSLRLSALELIQTIGVFFFILSLSMTFGLILAGDLTAEIAILSIFLTIPLFLGMSPGERLRARINDNNFLRWFLIGFLILGLNMIRRSMYS